MTPTSDPVRTPVTPAGGALTRAACLALLATGGHGRVAATMRAVPIIIAVSFTLLDEDVVFSPGLGEGFSRAVANSVVAFEADSVGPDGRVQWDVQVTAVARAITGQDKYPRFRLSTELITGWRARE